jgi:SAM-dependent methyltransferase
MAWYREWFQTPYYDILYKHRDENEAVAFIDGFFNQYPHNPSMFILDLACGNGRHSLPLAKYGKVIGLDINSTQIAKAKARNIPNASFLEHDMKKLFKPNYFDFVFNLFSSFGYFDTKEEDLLALENVYNGLQTNGYFIQDFLNCHSIANDLKANDTVIEGAYKFEIKRWIAENSIIKSIEVIENGNTKGIFHEKIRAYKADELCAMHEQVGFKIVQVLGDYNMKQFEKSTDSRLIIISQKK